MILLIDPLNPLGSRYLKEEVKGICEIAKDHDLLIIDDITYRDFADKHFLSSDFAPERTILTTSLIKKTFPRTKKF